MKEGSARGRREDWEKEGREGGRGEGGGRKREINKRSRKWEVTKNREKEEVKVRQTGADTLKE